MKATLRHYFGLYAGVYFGSIILLSIFGNIVGKSFTGINIVMCMLCAQLVALHFNNKERRQPNNRERRLLIWASLLITIFLDTLPVLLIFISKFFIKAVPDTEALDSDITKYLVLFIVVMMTIMWIIEYAILWWVYGSWAEKKFSAKQNKR